jgi:uncharacterized lipoprotein
VAPRLILTAAVATLLLAGCSRGEAVRCPGGTAYLDAGSAEALRVPDDLTVPEETDALRVPGQMPAPDDPSVECLQYSPAYAGEREE